MKVSQKISESRTGTVGSTLRWSQFSMGHNYIKTVVVMVLFSSTLHYHLMMLNIFTKFQENISVDFKVA